MAVRAAVACTTIAANHADSITSCSCVCGVAWGPGVQACIKDCHTLAGAGLSGLIVVIRGGEWQRENLYTRVFTVFTYLQLLRCFCLVSCTHAHSCLQWFHLCTCRCPDAQLQLHLFVFGICSFARGFAALFKAQRSKVACSCCFPLFCRC